MSAAKDLQDRLDLPPCVIREMRAGDSSDRGYVFHRYVRTAHNCYAYRNMAAPAFQHYGARQLEILLDRCQSLVVHHKGEDDRLIGFIIGERPLDDLDQLVIHFAYVEYPYRKQKLGSAMLQAMGYNGRAALFVTHENVASRTVQSFSKHIHIELCPFYLDTHFHRGKN